MSHFDQSSSSPNQESPKSFFDDDSQDFFATSSSQDLPSFKFTFPSVQNTLKDIYFPANSLNSQKQTNNHILSTFNENYDKIRSQSTQLEQIHNLSDNSQLLFGGNNDSDDFFDENQENVHKSDDEIQMEAEMEVSSSIKSPESQEPIQTFQPLTLNVPNFGNEDLTTLPESIIELYKGINENYSDFTFTSIIAGQLCSDKFPSNAYGNLKMPLLMSLVTSRENKLHIMGVGQDVAHASMIMSSIGKFAQRFLRVTSNFDGITVNNNSVIEGGGIILATNGVAFLGNWQRIPPKSTLKLLREIETKTILVDKIQGNYPLETTIWAYWNHTTKIKKDLASISQFINVFGIPIIIDEVYSEERKEIIDDLLNQVATKPIDRSKDFQISDYDFHMYINYTQSLTVAFDSRAIVMLKNYFMATKMIRPDALSEKGYETLKIMAESHAKLSLRRIVSRQDVLVAISIAEKFIKEFFETDSYSSPVFSASSSASIDYYDMYMNDLYEWYLNFTKDILEKL
ncbi:minichromosome maintenance domain-containing protein 2 [Chironomus tepperi]|uniref:minichromosome maintenance domain-containing protein 2 n=1 Tax=Chironomus tepperi TaxID=113505 RepID=UPI00391EEABD